LREARAISSVHSEVVNLSHFVDSTVSLKRFICLLFRYFLAEEESNSIYRFTAEDRHAIEAIRTDKYADEGWIFHRSALKKDLT